MRFSSREGAGDQLRTLHLLGKCSTAELNPQPPGGTDVISDFCLTGQSPVSNNFFLFGAEEGLVNFGLLKYPQSWKKPYFFIRS